MFGQDTARQRVRWIISAAATSEDPSPLTLQLKGKGGCKNVPQPHGFSTPSQQALNLENLNVGLAASTHCKTSHTFVQQRHVIRSMNGRVDYTQVNCGYNHPVRFFYMRLLPAAIAASSNHCVPLIGKAPKTPPLIEHNSAARGIPPITPYAFMGDTSNFLALYPWWKEKI